MSTFYPSYFSGTTNATSATAITLVGWPNGMAYQQLPSVLASPGEGVPHLTPIEWLQRQIDDVCALATI